MFSVEKFLWKSIISKKFAILLLFVIHVQFQKASTHLLLNSAN